jgi:DNA-binding XRE family transcriptional regulator
MNRSYRTAYERELDVLLDQIFEEWDKSWEDLADKADLAMSTIYNIGNRVTRIPQFKTVWKLARAIGFQLQLTRVQKLRKAM